MITVRNVIDLKRNIDNTYKNEPNYRVKLSKLKNLDEKRKNIALLINRSEDIIDNTQPVFFRVAMDTQMRIAVNDVKLQLNDSYHNLIEIEKQIIHYLNLIAYQNRIFEKVRRFYNTTDDTRPVFPLPSRDEMWFEIHELGVAIGRKENLSYHQSRHSFGTFLISEGIPIESIAKMMGHSGIKTTQRYAEVTDKKISKDMDNLMAFRRAYGTGASREKKTKDILTDKEE